MPPDFSFMQQMQLPYQSLVEDQNSRYAELEKQREALRAQRASLNDITGQEYGQSFGSALVPFLAGLAGGSSVNESLIGGSQIGLGAWNQMQAQEDEQRKLFDTDIAKIDGFQKMSLDSIADAQKQQASQSNQLGLQYMTGQIPRTEPWEAEREAANERSRAYLQSVGQLPPIGGGGGGGQDEGLPADALNERLGKVVFPPGTMVSNKAIQAYAALNSSANSTGSLELRGAQAVQNVSSRLPYDMAAIPGAMVPEDIKKFRDLNSQFYRADSDIGKLVKNMEERVARGEDPAAVWGNDQQLQEMLSVGVAGFARSAQGTGASLTGTGRSGEVRQLSAYIPQGSETLADIKERMIGSMRGRDPIEFAKSLQRQIRDTRNDYAKGFGLYDPEDVNGYDDKFMETIKSRGGMFGAGTLAQMQNAYGKINPILALQTPGANPIGTAPTAGAGMPGAAPQGAAGKREFVKGNERKMFWVDAQGNRLGEAS